MALDSGYISIITQYVLQSKSQTQNLVNPLTLVKDWTLEALKEIQDLQTFNNRIFVKLVDLNIVVQALLVHSSSPEGLKELETESIIIETTAQNLELRLWMDQHGLLNTQLSSLKMRLSNLMNLWNELDVELHASTNEKPLLLLHKLYQSINFEQSISSNPPSFIDLLNLKMELNANRKHLVDFYSN